MAEIFRKVDQLEASKTIHNKHLPKGTVIKPENAILEPLCFPEHECAAIKMEASSPLNCLLCDRTFEDTGMKKNETILHHLLVVHQLVIADVDIIADFNSCKLGVSRIVTALLIACQCYIHYWNKRFKEEPAITEFCSVININTRPEDIGPKLQYYLLCDGLPEDKHLREQLQIKKLKGILQCQQLERTDIHFSRNCLFCNMHFKGNRSILFQHMVNKHAFNVGLPDNLVYVNDFLDKLEEKLNNLQCLYCEKTFKDRQTLKDHMRKKQHKKINPNNKEFDKYYMINYLESGKTWHDILEEDDSELNQKTQDEGWEDWKEEMPPIHCLFCEIVLPVTQDLLMHMKECHEFDLLNIKKTLALSFYELVKIVNYIRRQVYNCKCIFCKEKFESNTSLLHHHGEMNHFRLPEQKSCWDQPQYFFPTFENDGLLYGLADDDYDGDYGTTAANDHDDGDGDSDTATANGANSAAAADGGSGDGNDDSATAADDSDGDDGDIATTATTAAADGDDGDIATTATTAAADGDDGDIATTATTAATTVTVADDGDIATIAATAADGDIATTAATTITAAGDGDDGDIATTAANVGDDGDIATTAATTVTAADDGDDGDIATTAATTVTAANDGDDGDIATTAATTAAGDDNNATIDADDDTATASANDGGATAANDGELEKDCNDGATATVYDNVGHHYENKVYFDEHCDTNSGTKEKRSLRIETT